MRKIKVMLLIMLIFMISGGILYLKNNGRISLVEVTRLALAETAENGGAAAVQGQGDVKDSPYFKKLDVYNLKSSRGLVVLEKYPSFQQKTEYTCGPAAALSVVRYFSPSDTDSEKKIARIMGTQPAGTKEPGTTTRGMAGYFRQKGWQVRSSADTPSPRDYPSFREFVLKNLKEGTPIMVENVDWGGHWRVIIGMDIMDDTNDANDVLIFMDPYDTTDHAQDGYSVGSAQRFYYMWFDAHLFKKGEQNKQWLTARPAAK